MARRRTPQSQPSDGVTPPDPSQQDEVEIGREMGAQSDPENGNLVADEDAVRKAGALDTESVRENRRITRIVHNKRTGKQNILINVDDVLIKYDQILRLYPADSMYISVKRVGGGTAVQQVITSAPRTGAQLYDAIARIHGLHEEATYSVNFFDATSKEYRSKGQITMPNTRDPSAQGQSPMGYPPYGQPQPLGYQPPAPQQAPPPAAPDLGALLAGFRQLQEMMHAYQSGGPAPAPQPLGVAGDPVSAQFDQLRQMLDMLQQTQGRGAARGPVAAPAVNPQMAAVMMGMGVPPVQPPPGMIWTPGFGYVSVDALMQAVQGRPMTGGVGPRGPFRGPFAASRGGDGNQEESSPPFRGSPMFNAAQQQPPPVSAEEQFRDSISLIKTAANAAREFQNLFPGQEAHDAPAVSIEDDDSPMRIIETGAAKLVVNKKDGSIRPWETGFANMDKIFKFASEQLDIARSQRPAHPARQVLAPGLVEVTPDYRPPHGFAAVPLDATGEPQFGQARLPPPPSNVPPPLGYQSSVRQVPVPRSAAVPTSVPAPAPKRAAWGPPPNPRR